VSALAEADHFAAEARILRATVGWLVAEGRRQEAAHANAQADALFTHALDLAVDVFSKETQQ
jgi:hypothetical protein